MGAAPRTQSGRGTFCLASWCALLALAGLLSGCANGRYTSKTLPAQFRYQPSANVQTIELAKLASPTIKADVIANGDVLELSLSSGLPSERDAVRTVRVDERGKIYLAELGHVAVEGLELEAAEALIASQCVEQDLYHTPQVTITMKQQKMNQVTVVGAVKEPSTYDLRSDQCNLLAAIVAAGGLTEVAGTTVEIRHPGYRDGRGTPAIARGGFGDSEIELAAHEEPARDEPASGTPHRTVKVDLVAATRQTTGGYQLPDGAIVNVERHDPDPVYVYGLVRKAGEYEFPIGQELRLTSAIALAGDISNPFANKVYLIRQIAGRKEPVVVKLSLRKAKTQGADENLLLKPGDTISVEKTPLTSFYDAVRIVSFGVGGAVF